MRAFFFFNDTATTEIYPLSLHDALPISPTAAPASPPQASPGAATTSGSTTPSGCSASSTSFTRSFRRSEEHTSELQSQSNLVCRLLLEKKKKQYSRLNTCRSDIPDHSAH